MPLVVAVSTAISAANGLLIRDSAAFERAKDVNAILFDKTGTLTEGRFGVTDVVPVDGHAEDEVLRLAASLESQSEHPIAQGIVERARKRRLDFGGPVDFGAIPGKGVQAIVDGVPIKVVSPGYLKELGRSVTDEVQKLTTQGKTVVFVLAKDELMGAIALADIIRPESRQALGRLKGMGIRSMMITGVAKGVASWVAEEHQNRSPVFRHEACVRAVPNTPAGPLFRFGWTTHAAIERFCAP